MLPNPSNPLLPELWQGLVTGSLKIATVSADGSDLWLAEAALPAPTARRVRRQACFEAALRGKPAKELAVDFELTAPALSGLMREAAADMGLDVPLSRIPIGLPLFAHAGSSVYLVSSCESWATRDPSLLWRVSFDYPRRVLETTLARAERAVVERYLRGESHPQIALARGVSTRTVANQLAGSFEKLRASGRLTLLRALIERGAAHHAQVTNTLGTPAPRQRRERDPSSLQHVLEAG